jgi:hypothetical protein
VSGTVLIPWIFGLAGVFRRHKHILSFHDFSRGVGMYGQHLPILIVGVARREALDVIFLVERLSFRRSERIHPN